jgi:predicted nucleotidyltransferase
MYIVISYNKAMMEVRSKITQKILGYYLLNPKKEHYINELAGVLEVDPGNLFRQLKQLEADGVLVSDSRGREKYYRLNDHYPLLKELKKTFEFKYGIEKLIKDQLIKMKGLDGAYIFGSYAKNSLNRESDIDLLLIGSHSSLEALRKILPIQKSMGREINVVDMSKQEFRSRKKKKDEFLSNVLNNKTIKLV